jgi:hypothetical protein
VPILQNKEIYEVSCIARNEWEKGIGNLQLELGRKD